MPTNPNPSPNQAATDLPERLTRYGSLVRDAIDPILRGAPTLEPFYGIMAYHLGWVDQRFQPETARAGKSLRPALCLLLVEALGAEAAAGASFAAGVELLHNFSLVHDDLQDRSPTRRGRPTVWTLWGEVQAITVGDGMFSLAHKAWLSASLAERDPAAFVAINRALEETVIALCEGQYLDVDGEGNLDLTSEAYLTMIGRKTAALMGTSAWAGARVATADPQRLAAARAFGYEMGLAFQIRDDLLGIWGDESKTGKSASSDIASRKMTLPVILALEHGTEEQRQDLRARYGQPPTGPDDEQSVRAILEAAGADRLTAEREEAHWREGLHALAALGLDPAWAERLGAFARGFVARTA